MQVVPNLNNDEASVVDPGVAYSRLQSVRELQSLTKKNLTTLRLRLLGVSAVVVSSLRVVVSDDNKHCSVCDSW